MFTGNGATFSTTETIGALALGAGASTITLVGAGAGQLQTLSAATSFSRLGIGTALIRGSSLQTAATNSTRLLINGGSGTGLDLVGGGTAAVGNSTAGTTKTLSIVPYFIGDTTVAGNGSSFLTYDTTAGTSGGLRPLAIGEYTILTAGYVASADNVKAFAGAIAAGSPTVNSLLFTAGNTLTGTGTLTVNSGAIAGTSGTGVISGFGGLTLGNGSWNEGVITTSLGNSLTFNVPLAVTGGGGLTKSGAGTLTLGSNASTYSGRTSVLTGILNLGIGIPDSSSGTVAAASPLGISTNIDLYPSSTFVYAGLSGAANGITPINAISRNINLAGTGSGTATLGTGATTNNNDSNFNWGSIGGIGTGPRALLVQIRGDRQVYSYGGISDMSDGSAVSLSVAFSSGSSNSNGVLQLRGASTFSGPITLTGGNVGTSPGNLLIGGSTPVGAGASFPGGVPNVTASGTATLTSAGQATGTYANTITFVAGADTTALYYASLSTNQSLSGVIAGPGHILMGGTGSILSLSNANTYTGTTTVTAGVLAVGNNLALQNSPRVTTGAGVVTFAGSAPTLGGISGAVDLATKFTTGYGSVTNLTLNPQAGANLTYSGAIANGAMTLTKTGSGIQALAGTNTYSGGTTISVGTLTYLNTNAKPVAGITTVAAGATLGLGVATSGAFFSSADLDSAFAGTLASVTSSATSNVGIDTTSASFTYASAVSSTRGLVKLGANSLTLSGDNMIPATITIAGGILQVGAGGVTGSITSANNVVNNGSLVFNRTDNYGGNFTPNISGSGSLTLSAGTLTLTGVNTYTGLTTVSGGSFLMTAGSMSAGGGLAIAGGSATITGATTTWTNTSGDIIVGTSGLPVTFTISGGANVQPAGSRYVVVGNAVGANGNVLTITGANSKLGTVGVSALYVGRTNTNAQGGNNNEVRVLAGGALSSGAGSSQRSIVGTGSSNNKVTVDGIGSQWNLIAGNASLLIGFNSGDSNNGVLVSNGGNVNMVGGGQFINIAQNTGVTASYLTIQDVGSSLTANGAQINVGGGGLVAIGSEGIIAGTSNTLTVKDGGAINNLAYLMVGNSSAAANSNSALVQSTGLLEVASGIVVGTATATGNTLTIQTGGTLQFTNVTPTLTIGAGAGNAATINGGTLSYKGLTNTNLLNSNTGGTGTVGAFTWSGNNTFRLNASNDSGSGAFTFANNLGAKNYTGLELLGTSSITRAIGIDGTNGGTLLLDGATATVTGGITLIGPVTATSSTTASTLAGVLSGSGALTKAGAGKLTLSSTPTYGGNTTVTTGTLKLVTANAGNESSSVIIAASGAALELAFAGTDTVDKFFIGATQMAAGTYGASGSGATTVDNVHFLGTGTLTVTSGIAASAYDTWAAARGLTNLNNGVVQDPDSDGSNNLSEFAFNGNPLNGSSTGPFFSEMRDNNADTFKELTFTCAVRRSASAFTATVDGAQTASIDGITYTIEASATLVGSWNSTVTVISKSDIPPVASGLPSLISADWEYRTFSAFDGGTAPTGFIRAKVTQP